MSLTCTVCDRRDVDSPAAYACTACVDRVRRQLGVIVEFTADARAVAAGQTRRGNATRGTGGDRLPINLAAGARLDAVQATITTWARHVAAERGHTPPAASDPLVAAARWLTAHLDWMRHRREMDEFARDADQAARIVSGIVDRPGGRRYAGPCSSVDEETGEVCGADLLAWVGKAEATCRVCGWIYDVDERQRWMRDEVRDKLARAVEIPGILGQLGVAVGYSTVAAYVKHRRLEARDVDAQGRPLYRLGDVIDLRTRAATSPEAATPRAELAPEAT